MKSILALVLFAAVANATLIPRDIVIPEEKLFPRMTGAEWTRVLENQKFSREIVRNFRPGTHPQPDGAGAIRGDVTLGSRIVGGSVATRGQFPWQVSVTMDSSYFCGGSIISQNWVLTAGHCVDGISSFRLVFGTNTPDGGASGSVAQTSRNSILHESYNGNTIANDIGLIKLSSALSWSTYIGAVRLPAKSDVGDTLEGETTRVSGWGKTSDNAGGISNSLMFVDLPVISNADCAKVYGSTVKASNICCSGANAKSTCNGDSGGPLCIQGDSGLWTEVGIVSFGASAGCQKGFPAAFTRVTSYLGWIETQTGITIRS